MSALNSDNSGRRAEMLAGLYLRAKGFNILARRFQSPVGEIDLIANRQQLLTFIEVKLRQSTERALQSVTTRQRNRVARAAQAYLQKNPQYAQFDIRFDVIVFGRWTWPTHVEDAWRAEHF